jgi:hypothetical protein
MGFVCCHSPYEPAPDQGLLDCRRGVLGVAIVPFSGRWDRSGPLGRHPLFLLSVGTPGHQFFPGALLLLRRDFALWISIQLIPWATRNQRLQIRCLALPLPEGNGLMHERFGYLRQLCRNHLADARGQGPHGYGMGRKRLRPAGHQLLEHGLDRGNAFCTVCRDYGRVL